MALKDSIGRFSVRKTLRFEITPLGRTADFLCGYVDEDETRAAGLGTMKAVLEAEHLNLVRRVFRSLPDPLPDAAAIRAAFLSDPEYRTLNGANPAAVVDVILERCRCNGWRIPKPLFDLKDWPALFVKWHWHCKGWYALKGEGAVPNVWAGRAKADVERTSPLLRTPKRRKPSRNNWFDHAPFRLMFGNWLTGYGWLKEDFPKARNFILKDGERVLVGVVPRGSRVCPHAMPEPGEDEAAYWLYEESQGVTPRFRPIPRAPIDASAERGALLLFELTGRGLRGSSNPQATLLRALLSEANFAAGALHLDKSAEFHARKGADLALDGKPDHFRQRFAASKVFVTFHVTCNWAFVGVKSRPEAYRNVLKLLETDPSARIIRVRPAKGGYEIVPPDGSGTRFVPTAAARSGHLSGPLARLVTELDAVALFDYAVPKAIRRAVYDKFAYVVRKGTDPFADGGVCRGYQLIDRLYLGDFDEARAQLAAREAVLAKPEEVVAKKPARKAAEGAQDFSAGIFAEGRYLFGFRYTLPGNIRREGTMRADSKDEVYRKLRTVGINAFGVVCRDPSVVGRPLSLPGVEKGSTVFTYTYMTSDGVRHAGEIRADSKDEAYAKLRSVGIKPIRVLAEDESSPALKRFFEKG